MDEKLIVPLQNIKYLECIFLYFHALILQTGLNLIKVVYNTMREITSKDFIHETNIVVVSIFVIF